MVERGTWHRRDCRCGAEEHCSIGRQHKKSAWRQPIKALDEAGQSREGSRLQVRRDRDAACEAKPGSGRRETGQSAGTRQNNGSADIPLRILYQ